MLKNKVLKYFTIGLCALCIAGCSTNENKISLEVGMKAPPTSFNLLDGNNLLVDEQKGKTLVVMFWGTWCSKSKQDISKRNK